MAKDLCTLMEEAKKSRYHGTHTMINLDPQKRINKKKQKEKYANKYKRIMEEDE